ncbi:MAG: hypothetical protein FWH36_06970, partial [Lentimicrobiaceae bacterium]|nr:hypothetical protein [Lentimicrobiaceae bacterium]
MEQTQNMQPDAFESIRETLREVAQLQKESRAEIKEAEEERKKSRADFDRKMKESRAEFDIIMKEAEEERKKSSADFDRRMKEIQKTVGGWANNHGEFAEEYFFNSFENGKQNFFGERFDDISKKLRNKWQGIEAEYDIVLFNHASVALIEVKYKAHVNNIPEILKKAETFRILFPQYKDFKIYLGLASMSFYTELEQECINEGIAIIKQVGDAVVINDAHL